MHRLCPEYASDVTSPLRHVRTRIYYTSESHMHSLVNVLRYCHLDGLPGTAPLVAAGAQALLDDTPEFDYLTHVVVKMFENKQVRDAVGFCSLSVTSMCSLLLAAMGGRIGTELSDQCSNRP